MKVEKVEKQVAGKGEVTVYTVQKKEATVFGVSWHQVAHYDSKSKALAHLD